MTESYGVADCLPLAASLFGGAAGRPLALNLSQSSAWRHWLIQGAFNGGLPCSALPWPCALMTNSGLGAWVEKAAAIAAFTAVHQELPLAIPRKKP